MITSAILKKIYPPRKAWERKGNFGKLLIIGGSKRYSGAPAISAFAALHAGVDLTLICAPERAANIAAGFSPDLITYPLAGDYFSENHVREILRLGKNFDAAVIGPGLEREGKILRAIQIFLSKWKKPVVVDDDALHAVAANKKIVKKNFLLTPNSYEFFVLRGKKLSTNISERKIAAEKLAKELGCTILLKGHIDVISDGSKTELNKTGSPFMTKGGCGDTLSGIAGAYLARGHSPFKAACGAAFVNGRAGEIAAAHFGESLAAMDLILEVHEAIRK